MGWAVGMPPPPESCQRRENVSPFGDESVSPFRRARETRRVFVPIQQPLLVRAMSQCPERGLRGVIYRSVCLDQLQRRFTIRPRQLWKPFRHVRVLERQVFNTLARIRFPAPNPQTAKI